MSAPRSPPDSRRRAPASCSRAPRARSACRAPRPRRAAPGASRPRPLRRHREAQAEPDALRPRAAENRHPSHVSFPRTGSDAGRSPADGPAPAAIHNPRGRCVSRLARAGTPLWHTVGTPMRLHHRPQDPDRQRRRRSSPSSPSFEVRTYRRTGSLGDLASGVFAFAVAVGFAPATCAPMLPVAYAPPIADQNRAARGITAGGARTPRSGVAAAGCCWVTQWNAPRPQTRSTALMPTTVRPGNSARSVASALRVARAAEHRHQHGGVADVEVRVRRRQALPSYVDRLGIGRVTMRSAPSVGVAHRAQAIGSCPRSGAWFASSRVVLDDRHHRRRRDEAGEVVDVAVGVVADDAVAEPEHPPRAEVVAQRLLDLAARASCGLRFGLSRHASVVSSVPRAVDVDRAALEHDPGENAGSAQARARSRAARDRRAPTADTCRPRRCRSSRPARARRRGRDERRAVVAHPRVVGRHLVQVDALQRHAGALEQRAAPAPPAPRR